MILNRIADMMEVTEIFDKNLGVSNLGKIVILNLIIVVLIK